MSAGRGEAAPQHVRSSLTHTGKPGVVLLVAVLITLAVGTRFGCTINNDVAWYIYSAGAFLDGGRLYDSIFFEVNPPLMLYLTVPGVAFGRLVGLAPVPAYVLSVFAVIALSSGLAASFLPEARRTGTLLLVLLVLIVLPAGDFGQRSHLMVTLTVPYLLLSAVRLHASASPAPAMAVVAGALAGLGFAIKPHYLLVPATVEFLLWWRTRRPPVMLRPETLAMAAVLGSYAAAVLVFTPQYLTRVVPYALEVYNSAHRNSWSIVLARPETLLVPLAALLHLRTRGTLAASQAAIADVLTTAMLALFTVYLIQMKGWNYHIYPTSAMLVLLSGSLALAGLRGRMRRRPELDRPRHPGGAPLRLAGMTLAGALVIKAAFLADNRYPLMDRLMPVIDQHSAATVYFFSSNTWTGFPMTVYAGATWASRFPALWLLPGVINAGHRGAQETPALAEMERYTAEAVIADLSARPPDLVFVDARPQKPWYRKSGFDFIAHFSTDARFAALWARYQQIGSVHGFEIYRRRPGVTASSLIN